MQFLSVEANKKYYLKMPYRIKFFNKIPFILPYFFSIILTGMDIAYFKEGREIY
jgi:hypothetical protein